MWISFHVQVFDLSEKYLLELAHVFFGVGRNENTWLKHFCDPAVFQFIQRDFFFRNFIFTVPKELFFALKNSLNIVVVFSLRVNLVKYRESGFISYSNFYQRFYYFFNLVFKFWMRNIYYMNEHIRFSHFVQSGFETFHELMR